MMVRMANTKLAVPSKDGQNDIYDGCVTLQITLYLVISDKHNDVGDCTFSEAAKILALSCFSADDLIPADSLGPDPIPLYFHKFPFESLPCVFFCPYVASLSLLLGTNQPHL